MRLLRPTQASLYWICLAVLAAALIDQSRLHWTPVADRQLPE
jgi:hypothetical protein